MRAPAVVAIAMSPAAMPTLARRPASRTTSFARAAAPGSITVSVAPVSTVNQNGPTPFTVTWAKNTCDANSVGSGIGARAAGVLVCPLSRPATVVIARQSLKECTMQAVYSRRPLASELSEREVQPAIERQTCRRGAWQDARDAVIAQARGSTEDERVA